MRPLFFVSIGLLLVLLWIAGCNGGSSSSSMQGIGAPGSVRLLIGDAPIDEVSAVNISIVRIAMMYDGVEDSDEIGDPDDDGELEDPDESDEELGLDALRGDDDNDRPLILFEGNMVINLLDLANQPLDNLLSLSQVEVPSGYYKAIHLYLGGDNTVVLNDGSVLPLTVPAGKIAFDFGTFIMPGETEQILLDFDLSQGLELTGGQGGKLEPTIRIARLNYTGNITGVLGVPDGFIPEEDEFEVKIKIETPDDSIETELEVDSDEDDFAVNPYAFYLHGVPAGTYTVTFEVKYGDQTSTFTAPVTVVTGETTDMGAVSVTGITF